MSCIEIKRDGQKQKWLAHKIRRETAKQIVIDYFTKNPQAALTTLEVKELTVQNYVSIHVLRQLLDNLSVLDPKFLTSAREVRKINNHNRSVLIYRKNDESIQNQLLDECNCQLGA